jgi:anti-sigma factor RsiW
MTCDCCAELMSALLDGEASAFERRECLAHLESCPSCRATWQELQALQTAATRLADPPLPAELWARVGAALGPGSTARIICFPTARGRMVSERSELWTTLSRLPSRCGS